MKMQKRFLALIMTIMIFLGIFGGQSILAIDIQAVGQPQVVSSVRPYGSLSGYGQHWYNSGEPTTGTFDVEVTGMAWTNAQITLSLANFSSDVYVHIIVYRPDKTIAYNTADTTGLYLTMENSSQWHNIPFVMAPTGTYTVWYSIGSFNGVTPSSGRINCWIY